MFVRQILLVVFLSILSCVYVHAQGQETGDIEITFPDPLTRLEAGQKLSARWMNYSYSSRLINEVKIELYRSEKPLYTLTEKTPNDGDYTATVPRTIEPGPVTLRVSSIDGTAFDYSKEFTITLPVPIDIISPAPETVWHTDEKVSIKWQPSNPETLVYITLLRVSESGRAESIATLADGEENQGILTWRIPATVPGGIYRLSIRVSSVKNIKYSEPFSIMPAPKTR